MTSKRDDGEECFKFVIATEEIVTKTNGTFNVLFTAKYLKILRLPKSFHLRYAFIPDNILIRHCYDVLYDKMLPIIQAPVNDRDRPSVLFTGVPGIGKSLFLIYFIARLLAEKSIAMSDKRFAVEFYHGEFAYFDCLSIEEDNEGCLTCVCKSFPCTNDQYSLLNIPIISDIFESRGPKLVGKCLFQFSSHESTRINETIKRGRMYVLPTWSFEELLLLNHDDTLWLPRFERYGGIPCYVLLRHEFEINATENKLQSAINSESCEEIAKNFYYHKFIYTSDNYMLVHMNPVWSTEINDYDYGGAIEYTFATHEIFMLIVKRHINRFIQLNDNIISKMEAMVAKN